MPYPNNSFEAAMEQAAKSMLQSTLPYYLAKKNKEPNADGMRSPYEYGMSMNMSQFLASAYSLNTHKLWGKDESAITEEIADECDNKETEFRESEELGYLLRHTDAEKMLNMVAKYEPQSGVAEAFCWKPRPASEIMESLHKEMALQKAEREQTKNILKDLKATKSSTFTGKLKSFFVGNSKEYDKAMEAMERVSKGTMSKDDAALAVMAYLDIRKDKVRDHQYGRDRFDGMMRGLKTLVGPKEFKQFCMTVDAARKQRDPNYKGVTKPEDYMTPEEKAAEQAKAAQTKEAEQAKLDADRLARDAQDPERAAKNEKFIKWLSDNKQRNLTQTERVRAEQYIANHPGVREAAQKISEERGLELDIPKPPQQELKNAKPEGPKPEGPKPEGPKV